MRHCTTHATPASTLLALIFVALLSSPAASQQPAPEPEEVVTVHTRLVTVTALASGADGRALLPTALRVYADDLPQEIAFADGAEPSAVALLVDKSESMGREPAKRLPYAVETFLKAADPRNDYTLITFSEGVTVLGTFKGDADGRGQLLAALDRQPYAGGTALYDAFLDARKIVSSAPSRNKRALVVFTDAQDNSSASRLDDLRAGLDSIGGLTFVVVMSTSFATDPNRHDNPLPDPKLFETAAQLRSALDGEAYAVRSKSGISEATQAIARDLREAVQLAFYPSESAARAGAHALRVESTVRGLKLRARSRYLIR